METTVQSEDMGRTSIQVSDELADELHSRKGRGESYEDVIWRLMNDDEEDIATDGSSDGPESPSRDTQSRSNRVDSTPEETGESTESSSESSLTTRTRDSDIEGLLDGVEFPSTKDQEECIEAIRAAYEYLKENETATMSEFVQEMMPEHPVGYDAESDVERINNPDKRNRSTWWRKVVKPGLKALPDAESPPKGGSDWEYTGETGE